MADKPISALPALPGNLTLDSLLAVVQGGITYHTEAREIVNLTLNRITVTTNANGTSIRIPGGPSSGVQICFHTLLATYASGAYLRIDNWVYPQEFSALPQTLLQLNHNDSNYTPPPQNLMPPIVWNGETAEQMGNARIYAEGGGFTSSDTIRVNAFAIGRY